jgi:hypothetical protein
MVWQARHGEAGRGAAGLGLARHGMAGMAGHGLARRGLARHGMAGAAWRENRSGNAQSKGGELKNIEQLADCQHCELCGALITPDGADPGPVYPRRVQKHPMAVLIRRLAYLADEYPALAILLIKRTAGRTEQELADELKISQPAVHKKLVVIKKLVKKHTK